MPVQCIETGESFDSIKSAGTEMGLNHVMICHQLKGRVKSVSGFHFAYLPKQKARKERIISEYEKNAIDISGYEGLYKIGKDGSVFNAKRHCKLRQQIYNGYCYVSLSKNHHAKLFRVHRLVAMAYLPNPDNLPQVNHKDENKMNNNVDNLEWCSAAYNTNYGGAISKRIRNRKDRKPVMCIETGVVYDSTSHAERETGISAGAIRWCAIGAHKTSGKLHWKYV